MFAGGLVNEDTLSTPTPSGNARVRFIHISPDASPVDVAVDGSVVIESIGFSDATEFVPYPAGIHTLEVRQAGSSTHLLTVPGVSIAAGKIIINRQSVMHARLQPDRIWPGFFLPPRCAGPSR